MALELTTCRGTVFQIGTTSSNSFALSPSITGTASSPVLLQTITISDNIVNLPVLTLDTVRVLYVFGKAWGDISVGGLALLGQGGSGSAVSNVVSWYKSNNSYDNDTQAGVSLPGNASYKFYVTGLSLGDPDTEIHAFPFAVHGKIIGT